MATTNKTVLITGATCGIGLACAEIFAKNGYHLIITPTAQANTVYFDRK